MKTIKIALDRERELLFNFNAIAAAERALGGDSLFALFAKQYRKPSVRLTRAMLWAALLHQDDKVRFDECGEITVPPELSLFDCGDLLQKAGLKYCFDKLVDAWHAANAEAKGDDANAANPPTSTTSAK